MNAIRLTAAVGLVGVAASTAQANPPDLQTPSPVIYLADNLDEQDNLGWCIDTLGRGFAERLQAHSCKPRGGDVQFQLEQDTGLVRSVAFAEYCMAHAPDGQTTFALVTCDPTDSAQVFSYEAESGHIVRGADTSQCVTVGDASRSAGPFMSRELVLANCADAPERLTRWVIIP